MSNSLTSNTLTSSGVSTYGTLSSWGSSDDVAIFTYDNTCEEAFKILISYLTETDILELLKKLETKLEKNLKEFSKIVKSVIENRHFTESFLMEFANYIENVKSFYNFHNADILSGEYSVLALYIEAKK